MQAARALPCALCWAPAGTACQPGADHLGRYIDAYANGQLSRPDMTAVLEAAEVIVKWRMVAAQDVAVTS